MKHIIQCIPGTGKTYSLNSIAELGYTVFDTDDLLDQYRTEDGSLDFDGIVKYLNESCQADVLVTNLWLKEHVRCENYHIVYPSWNDWVQIIIDHRSDLISFGFETLKSWHDDYTELADAIILDSGQFLSDILLDIL